MALVFKGHSKVQFRQTKTFNKDKTGRLDLTEVELIDVAGFGW